MTEKGEKKEDDRKFYVYTSDSELTTKMRMHESKVEVNSEDELHSFIHSLVEATIGKDPSGLGIDSYDR